MPCSSAYCSELVHQSRGTKCDSYAGNSVRARSESRFLEFLLKSEGQLCEGMEDLPSLLQRDYGLKSQSKSAPMSAAKGSSAKSNINARGNGKSSGLSRGKSLYDADGVFNANQKAGDFNFSSYDDVFGGPPKYANPSGQQMNNSATYDDIFQSFSSAPIDPSAVRVFDTPVYDDDIFWGVRGVKSSPGVTYDDVFSGRSASPSPSSGPALFEDLLGGGESGFKVSGEKDSARSSSQMAEQTSAFDDLIPGFGNSEPAKPRPTAETKLQERPSVLPTDSPQNPAEDPFVVLEAESFSSNASSTIFHDPLEQFGMPSQSASINEMESSSNGTVGIDEFDGFPQAAMNKSRMEKTSLKESQNASPTRININMESMDVRSGTKGFVNNSVKSHNLAKADIGLFTVNADVSVKSTLKGDQQLHGSSTSASDLNSQGAPPLIKSDKNAKFLGDRWLTVDEIELITQPTLAPPPARAPPPLVIKQGSSSKKSLDAKAENCPDIVPNSNEFPTNQHSTQTWKSSQAIFESNKTYGISSIEELEDFAVGVQRARAQEREEIPLYEEEMESSSAAAASADLMKVAMERAEAKLKLAREARERDREEREKEAKLNKIWETERPEREGRAAQEVREREEKEREARAVQDAHEREEKEKQEQERERRRIEREREKEREREREREKDKIAVERATKEARDRAAAEARERAERAAVERATAEARERAAVEARERAERAAVERATAEARERAAAEARERAAAERAAVERAAAEARERAERAAVERAAAEARERAAAEARERAAAERAAVDRAAAEVRLRAERAAVERANAEARERAAERASAERAAAARERQRRNDNDLESFFGMGARPNSAPRQRPATSDTFFDAQSQNKGFSSEGLRRTSAGVPSGAPSGLRKASSAANITDDWTSLFTASSSEEFQEIEGETAERRQARLERHQRTLERAAKALAEKNERDMQAQREQAERHRFADTLDAEIKRWAAGKEGNLRALLSTLQYVLWPECGWQPVSLTDVITAASVKKVYRKATLCVHPDKVQQKGANTQQKYIAEKVFDLLKEAWNKFNSEELF